MACIMASKTISVCTIIFIEKENAYYKTHLHYLNLTFKPPKRKINYKKTTKTMWTLYFRSTTNKEWESKEKERECESLKNYLKYFI